jgi:hypothetical protein
MNTITALQTELLQGGRLERGRINQRVFVGGEFGGAWYELSMSNDRADQRAITARREDCVSAYAVGAASAGRWLTRLRDHKEAMLEANARARIIVFTPSAPHKEVGA